MELAKNIMILMGRGVVYGTKMLVSEPLAMNVCDWLVQVNFVKKMISQCHLIVYGIYV